MNLQTVTRDFEPIWRAQKIIGHDRCPLHVSYLLLYTYMEILYYFIQILDNLIFYYSIWKYFIIRNYFIPSPHQLLIELNLKTLLYD